MSFKVKEKDMLNIVTPYGDRYRVNDKGEIIRTDMKFKPNKEWLFIGLSHVKRNELVRFKDITPEMLKSFKPCWKNGKPQFTVRDNDHGTIREWGNTKYHGVKNIYFD